jgi:polyhydroxybutyrate depolymerase
MIILALAPLVACSSSSFQNDGTPSAAGSANEAAGSGGGGGGGSSTTTPVAGDSGTGTADGGNGSSTAPGDAAPPGQDVVVTSESVQVWGGARTYTMVAPKDVVAGKAYPLVFVFHGDGGNGASMRSWIQLDAQSGDGAIVVYPDGKNATWDLYTVEASNEDDAFVDAMLAAVKAKYSIDGARVFGSGYSSGAFFINQLACRRTGFFRAIAPNAGGAPEEPNDPAASTWSGTSFTKCANQTGGVAAIVMHGNDDTTVGTGSGSYTAKYWAHVNGCDASEEGRTPTTPSPCVQHASCPNDKRVVYCEIAGIGHGVWNESGKASWAFFSSL